MSPLRILGTAFALPIAQLVVGGLRIGVPGSAGLVLAALVCVALLLSLLRWVTAQARHQLARLLPWPTLAVAATLLIDGLVCWAAMVLAGALGLPVYVGGYLPALCASLVIPIVAGLLVTAIRGLWLEVRPG